MRILVTGAKGFVGKNLCAALKNICDNKDRRFPDLKIEEIFEYDIDTESLASATSSPSSSPSPLSPSASSAPSGFPARSLSSPSPHPVLDRFCAECDFVFNLAGVNRPQNQDEFMKGNFGFASTLLDTLKKYHNTCPVMLSSSQQASLTGRFGNSEYGRSKKAGEDLFLDYERDFLKGQELENLRINSQTTENTDGTDKDFSNSQILDNKGLRPRVLIYRFPNLFGKWCRPNYNSAVATFCNAFANDLPYTVNDPSVELELLYIDDLVDEMLACLEGKEHRCEFNGLDVIPAQPSTSSSSAQPSTSSSSAQPSTSSSAQPPTSTLPAEGSVSSGLSAGGRYCYCPITHHVTLGEIVDLLKSFAEQPRTLMIPEIPAGSFAKKLYSTYLSYLPYEKTAFPLKMNVDERGSFTELVHTHTAGQVSINISKPGITKGQHWHNTKFEQFIVVKGHGLIQQRSLNDPEGRVLEWEVDGDHIQAVHMLPGYTHNIINLSDTEDLVTVMYCNEVFNPERPDTFFEKV